MAVNKSITHSNIFGRMLPIIGFFTVQAGTTQQIKKGEICKIRSLTDFATYPIIPAVADDSGFIPIIANEEQTAIGVARTMQFYRPMSDDRFYFALNTATVLKNGDQLEIHDSQTLKKGTSNVVAIVDDPELPQTGKSVSEVRVAFVKVTADGLNQDPYLGTPTQVNIAKGLDNVISDPGTGKAIPVTAGGSVALTIAASATETNTVAAPASAGLQLAISAAVVGSGGSRAITFAAAIDGTNDIVTFDAAGEYLQVVSVQVGASSYAWRQVAIVGATASAS